MKKTTLFCLLTTLLAASVASASDWRLVNSTQDRKDYIDFNSLKKDSPSFFSSGDPAMLLETKTTYLVPLQTKYATYSSSLDSWAIKCSDRTITRTAASVFGLNGQLSNRFTFRNDYQEIGNNYLFRKYVDFACNNVDPTVSAAEASGHTPEWVEIKSDSTRKYFMDTKSIKKAGDGYLVVERVTFFEDQVESFGKYRTITGNVFFNCDRETLAYGSDWYSDESGATVKTFTVKPADRTWAPIEDSDFNRVRYKLVCQRELKGVAPTAQKSTERPKTQRSSGSGFVIDKLGNVLTNNHVVSNCSGISVLHNSNKYEATLVSADDRLDLALLRTKTLPSSVPIRREPPTTGQIVYAAGFPLTDLLSKDMNFTPGMISATSGIGGDVTRLQITAPIQPGNSGGPLLDESGGVAGVVVSKLDAVAVARVTGDIPQNINFAIKSDVIRIFLDSNRIKYESVSGVPKSATELAEKARLFTVQVLCN
jgi:S1-C subfamily serine protease